METAADELAPLVGRKKACAAVGLSRAGWYRRHRQSLPAATATATATASPVPASPVPASPVPASPVPARAQPRALSQAERDKLNEVLHAERFVDLAPAEIYATLLDEGVYLGSISTMYRELHRRHGHVPERRRQASHPAHAKPELRATHPNELWSWDVSKLRGPGKWNWFYLYWILDVYSRYAVGWCISEHETAAISERLITDTIAAHGIDATQLTIHADRGPQQTAKPVAQLYADLGITRSHSRPRVSNDNPYSEAGFKTFKYRPDFPGRFDSLEAAVAHGDRFFDWYNLEHHHWGLELLTPAQVHYGKVDDVIAHRQAVLDAAHAEHPERFVHRPPIARRPPDEAWINRPADTNDSTH